MWYNTKKVLYEAIDLKEILKSLIGISVILQFILGFISIIYNPEYLLYIFEIILFFVIMISIGFWFEKLDGQKNVEYTQELATTNKDNQIYNKFVSVIFKKNSSRRYDYFF